MTEKSHIFIFIGPKSNHLLPLSLTLFAPGEGGTNRANPPAMYLCISVQIHVQGCRKKLDFPQLQVWKRAVRYLPRKIISLC